MINKLAQSLRKHWHKVTDPQKRQIKRRIQRLYRERGRDFGLDFSNLDANSVAFDFGGYEGEWTREMRQKFNCDVHVFEPHPTFAANLATQFSSDEKVHCHAFALGASAGALSLSDSADASSSFVAEGAHVIGKIEAVETFFARHDIPRIHATKINIEGGEYDILPALIDSGLIQRFGDLVIQFHNYSSGDIARRDAIRSALAKTHRCVWDYEFVWEKWEALP